MYVLGASLVNGQNILGVMTGLGFFSNIDVNEPAAEERKTKTNVRH